MIINIEFEFGISTAVMGTNNSNNNNTNSENISSNSSSSPLPSPSIFMEKLNYISKQDFSKFNIPDHIKVKFVPLSVPRYRRLQTAAVAVWALLLPITVSLFLLCV